MDALGVAPCTAGTAVYRRFDSCRVLHEIRQADANRMHRDGLGTATGGVAMKRNIEIRTESFIRVNGALARFDTLPEELKREAATKIKLTYMNELYRGKAVFEARKEKEETQ